MPDLDHPKYAGLPPFLEIIWRGNMDQMMQFLRDHAKTLDLAVNEIDPRTGMNALHIAVGRNNLEMAKILVVAGVKAIPDKEGRMPSLIAGKLGVSDEMCDFIFDVESRDLKVDALQGV